MSVKATTLVGSYPAGASPYGVLDMAGNAAEWVADWFAEDYQRSSERNPRGPDAGQYRVLRGGSWVFAPIALRGAARHNPAPDGRSDYVGFRCASGLP
jgi:formylglycine-generating enzyme required for sulfatase activity